MEPLRRLVRVVTAFNSKWGRVLSPFIVPYPDGLILNMTFVDVNKQNVLIIYLGNILSYSVQ